MNQQTKKAGSKFGGEWTKQKLLVIGEYLKAYTKVLKNTKVRKIYVDAFAGSGKTEIEEKHINIDTQPNLFNMLEKPEIKPTAQESILDGSAVLSLKYDFDEYYFIELDKDRITQLEERIKREYPNKMSRVHFVNDDCNNALRNVVTNITRYDRCLMFLDPYALELEWSTLDFISKNGLIDVWYLFPLYALTRIVPKDGTKENKSEESVSKLLGTEDWKTFFYKSTGGTNLFGERDIERVEYVKLLEFIIGRFKEFFNFVFDKPIVLKQSKNSPLFLLCFMMTNKEPKAIKLASKLVTGIKNKLEKVYGKN